jgi:hypothetical protein
MAKSELADTGSEMYVEWEKGILYENASPRGTLITISFLISLHSNISLKAKKNRKNTFVV